MTKKTTDRMNHRQHFYMAYVAGAIEGEVVAQVNTLCPSLTKNINAAGLTTIQINAKKAFQEMGAPDTIQPLIQNVFYLGHMTEAEFFRGTNISPEEIARQQQARRMAVNEAAEEQGMVETVEEPVAED